MSKREREMCIFDRFSVLSGNSARAVFLSVVSGARNMSGLMCSLCVVVSALLICYSISCSVSLCQCVFLVLS